MKQNNFKRREIWKAIVVFTVVLALVLPGAVAFANNEETVDENQLVVGVPITQTNVASVEATKEKTLPIQFTTTSEQINEADEDKKYELKHSMVFSKDDLVFDTLMGYDTVVLKDGSCIDEIGKPMLPAKQIRIAVPAGMEVLNVHVVTIEREELPGTYNVFPVQPPVRTDESDVEIEFVRPDAEIYTSSNPYPPEDVKLGEQTDLAGQAMIPVTIYPLRYIPEQKTLSLITSIELVIDGVDGYVCGDYLPRKISVSGREMYNHMVTGMVENPEDVELQSLDAPSQSQFVLPGDYDYVIITQDSWVDDFQ